MCVFYMWWIYTYEIFLYDTCYCFELVVSRSVESCGKWGVQQTFMNKTKTKKQKCVVLLVLKYKYQMVFKDKLKPFYSYKLLLLYCITNKQKILTYTQRTEQSTQCVCPIVLA